MKNDTKCTPDKFLVFQNAVIGNVAINIYGDRDTRV